MRKTPRLIAGVAILAVLVTAFGAAHGRPGTSAQRVRPGAADAQTALARAVPRQGYATGAEAFVPDLHYAGTAGSSTAVHPIVGSWFGKAIQVCPDGVAPSACANGLPAIVLYMTPTLTPDGLFVADDSLTLLTAPFGPHTTAHGSWTATSGTAFTAEYAFMNRPWPPAAKEAISGLRARWVGQMVDANTAVGWVNAYFQPATPATWVPLRREEFPALPGEANGFVTPVGDFITDPTLCPGDGCPLVFKFTIKRVHD